MTEEHDLAELINEAISCEHPHVYGTINLNRLRDVLCLLVSARARCDDEHSNAQNWNEPFEKDCEIERNLSQGGLSYDSFQNVNVPEQGPSKEQANNENGSKLSVVSSRSPSPISRDQSIREALQNVLLEVAEIVHKVNEIDERLKIIETRSLPLKCARVSCCGVPAEEENISPSTQNNVSNSDKIAESNTQINVAENVFDVEQSETWNGIDAIVMSREASLTEAVTAVGNLVGETTTSDQPSVASDKNIKHSMQHQAIPVADEAFQEYDEKGEDCHNADDEKSTLPASASVENVEKTTMGDVFSAKFDLLVAIVVGLLEREERVSERLRVVEKMMTSYTNDIHNRHEEADYSQPLSLESIKVKTIELDPKQNSQGTQKTVPEIVAKDNNLVNAIQCKVNEIENEMCFLKAIFNNPNIAAGGTVGTEGRKHVQCISCNCTAEMEVFETPVPQPMPFHVKRCLKPLLRSQLDSLRKELKYSVYVPVDMEPYWKLLKKPNLQHRK